MFDAEQIKTREKGRTKRKGIFYVKANSSRNKAHKTTRKSFRVIVQHHSVKCLESDTLRILNQRCGVPCIARGLNLKPCFLFFLEVLLCMVLLLEDFHSGRRREGGLGIFPQWEQFNCRKYFPSPTLNDKLCRYLNCRVLI